MQRSLLRASSLVPRLGLGAAAWRSGPASASLVTPSQQFAHRPAASALASALKASRCSAYFSNTIRAVPSKDAPSNANDKDINYETGARPSINMDDYFLPHPIWDGFYVNKIDHTHHEPQDWVDKLALNLIRVIRFNFDIMSGYKFGRLTESKVLRRCIFLETIAAVPGSIASTLRHLSSLRNMKSDRGWIHTLLEEAENERMHLLTFLEVKSQGSALFRWSVVISQGVFYNFFFVAYSLSPRFCHRMVGYLEEEAVRTYTRIMEEIESGELQHWKTQPAPARAKKYWQLPETATMKDVIKIVRADEAHHRDVNHTFAGLDPDAENPFPPGH